MDGGVTWGGAGGLASATLIGDTYTWTFRVKDNGDLDDTTQIDETYWVSFEINNLTSGTPIGSDQAEIGGSSTTLNPIPEFPLIALPVAAVIGLMFIIRSRKKEE